MSEIRTFEIEGMTCEHCAATITDELKSVEGVESAVVSFPERRARIWLGADVPNDRLIAAVAARGYCARPLEPASAPQIRIVSGGTSFDLVIIGSGGAAFAAALKASELGAKVAMVERGVLGGTCVNIGCVPSKTLIRAAEALHRAQRTPFAGLSVQGRLTDFVEVTAQKDLLVGTLRKTKYADVLARMPNVQFFEGRAEFTEKLEVRAGTEILRGEHYIVATGARPAAAEIPGLKKAGYLTSTDALALRQLPPSLLVLGGRYVALELAQAFARLGSKVTIIQRSDHILPTEDDDLTEALAGYLREEGIDVVTGAVTRSVRHDGGQYELEMDIGGARRTYRAAQLLVATGRRANTDDLGLERPGVTLCADGTIAVDDYLQTTAPGIYAAGDVVGDPAFVYTAAYEGSLAVENALLGNRRKRDYAALPWVMFTDPQVAVVGLNERRAREAGIPVDVTKLPLSQVPRALAARDTRGFIKLLKERGGDRLLGASILAPEAGDLIMEPALAIRHGIGVSALASAFHPYLTQAEGIKLAAQTFSKDVSKLSCCAS